MEAEAPNLDEITREGLISSAGQAAVAVEALLRVVRDGEISVLAGEEVLEKLLDAAKILMDVTDVRNEEEGQVHAAVTRFLEGWA